MLIDFLSISWHYYLSADKLYLNLVVLGFRNWSLIKKKKEVFFKEKSVDFFLKLEMDIYVIENYNI